MIFFNLDWQPSPDMARNPRYRHNAIAELANMAALLVQHVATLPLISRPLTDHLPPIPFVVAVR